MGYRASGRTHPGVHAREDIGGIRNRHNAALCGRKTIRDYREALSQALHYFPELEKEITATRQLIAFRNRLIHAYASVDPEIVWGVIEEDMPVMRSEVEELLHTESN